MKVSLFRADRPVALPNTDTRQIRLVSRGLRIDWQGGGLVWHHPWAVELRQGNRVRRLPIYNVTLLVRLALLGVVLALWYARRKRRKAG